MVNEMPLSFTWVAFFINFATDILQKTQIMTRSLLVAFILIFFASTNCSRIKKSIDNVDQSIFYDRESFSLSRGTIENKGLTNDNEYLLIVRLMSSTLYYTDRLGVGTMIEIHMNSSTPELNANKTFSLSNGSSSISKVAFYPNFDFENTYNNEITANSGSMIVTKAGNEYTIDFTFYSPEGNEIIGNYVGELRAVSRNGYFTVGPETKYIESGIISYYGSSENDNGFYNFDITLFSVSEYPYLQGEPFSAIYFEMWSDSPSALSDGTYNFDDLTTYQPYTISDGGYFLDYQLEYDYIGKEGFFTDCIVDIQKNNGIFAITFSGTDENGDEVEGNYQGELTFFDETSKKSTNNKLNMLSKQKQ